MAQTSQDAATTLALPSVPAPVRPPMSARNLSSATLVDEFGLASANTLVDEDCFFAPADSVSEKPKGKALEDDTDATDADAGVLADPEKAPEKAPEDTAFVAPDGGMVAWSQVLAGLLLNMVAWGTAYVFGIYQLYYTQTLGMDAASISWIGSVQTFLTYFFSTVSGLLADAGYAKHISCVGTALVLAGGLGTSFSVPGAVDVDAGATQTVPGALFVSQAVVLGLGLGLLTAPAMPSINAYFSRKRSLALAVSTLGTAVGGAVLPAVTQLLVPAVGFAWAMRVCTLLSVGTCVGATLLLKPAPDLAKKPNKTPSKTPNKTTLQTLRTFGSQLVDTTALREAAFIIFVAGSFTLYWGLYFAFYYINTYAEEVCGFSSSQGTALLIMSTALGIPTRVLAGLFADFVAGPLDTLVLATALQGTLLLLWLAVGSSATGMYLFVVFFGLANGATQSVWVGCISALSKHAGDRIGARFGMVCVVAAIATLAGAPTASALIGSASLAQARSYHTAMIWAGATTLASAVLMGIARVKFVGWKLKAVN